MTIVMTDHFKNVITTNYSFSIWRGEEKMDKRREDRGNDRSEHDKVDGNVAYGSVIRDKDKRRNKLRKDNAKRSQKWYDDNEE